MDGPLSDLRVVEYAHFISGPYCAKLLADWGAEVIKVEPPKTGEESRRKEPFLRDVPHSERSGLFLYLNTNKIGVTLNVTSPTGAQIFRELMKWADIVVVNGQPKALKKMGLDYESLQAVNEKLIVTSITPFGQTGPYRDYKATDLVTCHMGGLGYGTGGPVKEPEREPPLRVGGHQAHFLAGLTGAVATMHAVFARQMSEVGQHVDISEQEAMAAMMFLNVAQYAYENKIPTRLKIPGRPATSGARLIRCKDGYFTVLVAEDRQWESLVELMGNPEWAKNELFQSRETRREHWDSIASSIEEWALGYSKEEIYRAAQAKRIPVYPTNNMEDLFKSGQLAAREFFVDIDHPETGIILYPSTACKFSETSWRVTRPAPLLGQDNEDVFCGRLGYSKQDLLKMSQAGVI